MYKKYLPILIALLLIGTPVFALSIFTVFQGGTGRSTLPASQLIYGNGLNPVGSVATTSVTCSGSTTCTSFTAIGGAPITISSTAGTGDFPFTVNSWGNSTTSTLGFLNGFLSTASSTISAPLRLSSLGQGFLFTGSTGLVQPIASSSIQLSWFNNDAGFEAGLTAGDALTRTGNDFDFDGGTSPGGSLGGTWASPTIDDLFILNTGDVGTGSYTFPYASSTGFSSSYASSTLQNIGTLTFGGVTGSVWSTFCTSITGGAGLCDGVDDTGGAGFSGAGNSIIVSDSAGTALIATSSFPLYVGTLNATSTTATSTFKGATYVAGDAVFGQTNGNSFGSFYDNTLPVAHAYITSVATSSGLTSNVGIWQQLFLNPASDVSTNRTGILSNVEIATGTTANFTGLLRGIQAAVDHVGTGTLAYGYGGRFFSDIKYNGTITTGVGVQSIITTNDTSANGAFGTARGFESQSSIFGGDTVTTLQGVYVNQSGAGTVTNGYGIYLDNILGNNKWGIYESDTSKNYFAGNIGAGTTTPQWNLQSASTTRPQLALSGNPTDTPWTFRSIGNSFYLATSSPTTFATSSISALTINSDNIVRFGNSNATCILLTGSAGLCDGSDDGGAGTSAYEIATTSGLSVSQLAYFTKTGGMTTLGGISTSTLTAGSGLSGSFTQLGSGGSVACATANSSTFGCLTAAKFSEFDSATTTFSTGLTYSGVTNAVTVNTSQNISTLSNLTTNGLVTTSGGTGALSVTANGTNGQVLAMSGGVPTWVATTTAGTGLSYNGTSFLLNLANPNSWTALQTFNYSSSTAYSSFINASSTNLFAGNFTLSTTTAGTLKVASNGVVWSDTSGGGGGYATIQDEASNLTTRTILNFTGSGVNCVDNAGSTRTDCTINAGAATAGGSDKQLQFNDATALGGASGLEWNKNEGELSLASGNTLLVGATATSSPSALEVIKNGTSGLVAWFASTTGAHIRPIMTIFRNSTTGVSGVGINASTTEDALTVNGFANFDPQMSGCDLNSLGTITTDQLAGQFCDWLQVDSITDGGILQSTLAIGTEPNMPIHTVMRAGDTTSWASNEGVWIKTGRGISATTTLMAEIWLRTPNTNVSTTTGTYMWGLGNPGTGSLTTTAAYANPTNTCSFQASSTANWIAIVKKDGTFNEYADTGIATSTTQSTFRRFRIRQNYVDGCTFYVDGVQVASETAANSPVGVMQVVWGIGNNGAGVGTVGTASNHYFMYAEPKIGWGRWQPK